MRIVAIMPIKLKNERLPGKNLMMLGGKPLMQHELDNLLKMSDINRICVYCSDDKIISFLPEGIDFLKRPRELDLPTSNFTQIFQTFCNEIDADIYMYAHATAPFVTEMTMRKCLNSVISGEYDSAFCAVKIQDFLWQYGRPLNFDAKNLPRSQDLEPIYRETSGVYCFTKQVFEEYRSRIGKKPYICEVSYKEAIDINEPEDFELAKLLVGVDL